jgi:hypothetical protein
MRLARTCGQAEQQFKKTGVLADRSAFEKAETEWQQYQQLCKNADRLSLHIPIGALYQR